MQYKRESNDQGYNPLIVFFSSSEVYGNTTNASVENHIYELFQDTRRGSYALSKLLEENLYNNLKEYEYTNTVIMRLFNIVGETQTERFVLPKLLNHAMNEERFVVTPTYRSFCHIDFLTDCVNRIIRQFEKLGKTTFPHLTNFTSFREENYVSMPELVDIASKVLDKTIFVQLVMTKPEDIIYRKSEKPKIPPMFLDHTKDIPLEEIIRRMHEARQ
jgi:nucleoside-diphosphate-sugar epimerase